MNLPFFVYGTLKRGGKYHSSHCGNAKEIRPAIIQGTLYHLPSGYPGLLLGGQSQIRGELVFFDDEVFPSALEKLDLLEDYRPQIEKESEYLRREIMVKDLEKSCEAKAWVYVYNRVLENSIIVSSGVWTENFPGNSEKTKPRPGFGF